MVSNMGRPGSFHRRIMTSGGKALMESGCMLKVYGPALDDAVPECTPEPPDQPNRALSDHSRAEQVSPLRCAIEHSGEWVCQLQLWNGGGAAISRTICC